VRTFKCFIFTYKIYNVLIYSYFSADPSFSDYLALANPYTYLEGPLNEMAGKLGDAVDLLGDKASGFVNSMKDLGGSASGAVTDGFSVSYCVYLHLKMFVLCDFNALVTSFSIL
jgi:hypothetical protein